MHNLGGFKEKVRGVEEWLRRELSGIRTGRATPAILDGVMVKAYGGERLPVSHLASGAVEDARTLRVTPWDKAQVKEIAQQKLGDLNTDNIDQAMKMIEGTAKSLGITVE